MNYRSITCDTCLKTITNDDTLFLGKYTVDPYQNCAFGCSYCDSSFDDTVGIKINAPEILHKELSQHKKGMVIVGSVHDPYQPAEKTYELTRQILQVLHEYDFPYHILTKSPFVLRDLDLLTSSRCLVTISILSHDQHISQIFERNAPSLTNRLQTMQTLRQKKIYAGVAMIPILPYLTDQNMEQTIRSVSEKNAQYFLHKPLELKGDQRRCVESILHQHFPQMVSKYHALYLEDILPTSSYQKKLNSIISTICKTYHISETIKFT